MQVWLSFSTRVLAWSVTTKAFDELLVLAKVSRSVGTARDVDLDVWMWSRTRFSFVSESNLSDVVFWRSTEGGQDRRGVRIARAAGQTKSGISQDNQPHDSRRTVKKGQSSSAMVLASTGKYF